MKPKLLIIELWGLGDIAIGTPFLRAATQHFDVTLLAKPYALDLQRRFWPEIKIIPFVAPWTAFTQKYYLWRWPLPEMFRLCRKLAAEKFDFGFSSRWDPRDHLLLKFAGVKERIGYPRVGSAIFLTRPLRLPPHDAHRYEAWRLGGKALGIELPSRDQLPAPPPRQENTVLLHSGARLPARIWPLENWRNLALRLRAKNYAVQIACDPSQENWWKENGETAVECPRTVTALISLVDRAGVLIGNCSGPGHIAASCGVPTFTIFGPSLIEWWAPLHPYAECVEGLPCPYKPCSDYCRYSKPICIQDLPENVVWPRLEQFVQKRLPVGAALAH